MDEVNLLMSVPGKDYKIARLRTKDKDQERFLANLGFVEGSLVSVVSESMGNLIVKVKGSRVALGRDLAMRINVIDQ